MDLSGAPIRNNNRSIDHLEPLLDNQDDEEIRRRNGLRKSQLDEL